MKTRLLGILLVPMLLLFAAHAHADAIIVGTALSDHAGSFVLDLQVDPNADPVYVADQLKSNLEMSSGSIKSVKVEDGIAHVKVDGATPKSEVQAMLNNDVALATGVGPSPAGTEYRRRAFWLLGGLGGLAFIRLAARKVKGFFIVAVCQQEFPVFYHHKAGRCQSMHTIHFRA